MALLLQCLKTETKNVGVAALRNAIILKIVENGKFEKWLSASNRNILPPSRGFFEVYVLQLPGYCFYVLCGKTKRWCMEIGVARMAPTFPGTKRTPEPGFSNGPARCPEFGFQRKIEKCSP